MPRRVRTKSARAGSPYGPALQGPVKLVGEYLLQLGLVPARFPANGDFRDRSGRVQPAEGLGDPRALARAEVRIPSVDEREEGKLPVRRDLRTCVSGTVSNRAKHAIEASRAYCCRGLVRRVEEVGVRPGSVCLDEPARIRRDHQPIVAAVAEWQIAYFDLVEAPMLAEKVGDLFGREIFGRCAHARHIRLSGPRYA